MNNKMQSVIEAIQQEVCVAAEQKLGRSLSEAERRGIQGITSLMMLESCYQSFCSPAYSPAQALADLEYFTELAQ